MDIENLLKLLKENEVQFVVIGAAAFPTHGYSRATIDFDFFIKNTENNALKTRVALEKFGYDVSDLTVEDLLTNKVLIRQYVLETDIHPFVTGITFDEVWSHKVKDKIGGIDVYVASLDDLIKMKKAAGRSKDLEDIKILEQLKMPKLQLLMECKKCGKIFSSGISMSTGSSATFIDNKSQCSFCGSMENIPDGTFKATVEKFVKILEQSPSPLNKANELLAALEKSKSSGDLTKIKKWLPDSPEKIAAYIAIICTIIQLLTQKPNIHIEYNDLFINQYNQVINIDIEKNLPSSSAKPHNPPKAD